jgi:hypothetical protein
MIFYDTLVETTCRRCCSNQGSYPGANVEPTCFYLLFEFFEKLSCSVFCLLLDNDYLRSGLI